MGKTSIMKIMERASGHPVKVGDRVWCRIDWATCRDFGGANVVLQFEKEMGKDAKVWDKQICEGYEDAERFAVMRKVGLTDAEIRRSVNSQVLTVFFAPLLMAGLHMLFAMPMIRLILGAFGLHNDSLFYGIGIGCYVVFAVIYALMYLLTSRRYYRIVR